MRIGFAYNLKNPAVAGTDAHAEYETPETVEAIAAVLGTLGEVVRLNCVPGFLDRIIVSRPDLVFTVAEGWGGRDRESLVPAACRLLGIPCTGSDAVALGITMDKALTKRVLRDAGLRTPPFMLCNAVPDIPPSFDFPVFVKPNADGTSRGITVHSRVNSFSELRRSVETVIRQYGQSALVEPYLSGRDFCVGLIGGNDPETLPVCEILLGHEDGIPFFSYEYKRHDTDRLAIPPELPSEAITDMMQSARAAWDVLGIRDYCRIDFRTDSAGVPYLLEVNALPGLSPVSGILVRQAAAAGIAFDDLIRRITARALGEASETP